MEQNKAIGIICLQTPQSLPVPTLEMKIAVKLRKAIKKCSLFFFLVMDYIREGEKKITLIMVKTTIYCTEVQYWSTYMK